MFIINTRKAAASRVAISTSGPVFGVARRVCLRPVDSMTDAAVGSGGDGVAIDGPVGADSTVRVAAVGLKDSDAVGGRCDRVTTNAITTVAASAAPTPTTLHGRSQPVGLRRLA